MTIYLSNTTNDTILCELPNSQEARFGIMSHFIGTSITGQIWDQRIDVSSIGRKKIVERPNNQ